MTEDFGRHHNVKDWVFHNTEVNGDGFMWDKLHSTIMKGRRNIGYVCFHNQPSKKSVGNIAIARKLTLHIFAQNDWKQLNHLINQDLELQSKMINERDMMQEKSSNIWLIQMPNDYLENEIKRFLENNVFAYDTMAFVFTRRSNNVIEIFDAYRITPSSGLVVKRFGTWSRNHGLKIPDPDIWSRRRSLEGHFLKVASALSPPSVTYVEDKCESNNCFKGLFPDAWHALEKRMNFTYQIQRAFEWGNLVNGTEWSGMVGMVKNRKVDIAVADLTITRDRSNAVDFLQPLLDCKEELFMKNPDDAMSLSAYTKPFTQLSWVGIFISIIMISPIVAFVVFYGEYDNGVKLGQWYSFVSQALILRFGIKMPTKDASKIVVSTVLFAGIVIYQCWEASLESMLAIKKSDPPFRTLQGLSENPRYNLITARGTVYVDHFKYSKDPLYIKIWNENMKPYQNDFPPFGNLTEFAFQNPHSIIYADSYSKQDELYRSCKVIGLGHIERISQLAWAIQKESTFAEAFYYNINKLKEIGVIQKYYRAHWQQKQHCDVHGGDPIRMKQCASAFLLLICGACGGLFMFGIELFIPYKFVNWIYDLQNVVSKIETTRQPKDNGKFKAPSVFSLADRRKIERERRYKRIQYLKRNLQLRRQIYGMLEKNIHNQVSTDSITF